MTTTRTADCGHEYQPPGPNGGPSGYALSAEGKTMCYRCASEVERAYLADPTTTRAAVYLESHACTFQPHKCAPRIGTKVTTWPGEPVGTVTDYSGPHETPTGGLYYRVSVRTANARWHGSTQGPGMVVTLRRATTIGGAA